LNNCSARLSTLMVSLRASFTSNSPVAAQALAMALVILSALNLTKRPSLFLILVFIYPPPGMNKKEEIITPEYAIYWGCLMMIPLHMGYIKRKNVLKNNNRQSFWVAI